MEVDNAPRRSPLTKFVIQMIVLGAMAAVLGGLIRIMLSDAAVADAITRKGLVRLAWICTAFLGLTLLVMVWVFIRYLISRRPPVTERTRTEHVDAWAIAGQRFELPKEDAEGGDDEGADDHGDDWKKGK